MLPVESTPSGQSNLVSVEYTCIPLLNANFLTLIHVDHDKNLGMLITSFAKVILRNISHLC